MKPNRHPLPRQLIDLRIAHAGLQARIDQGPLEGAPDEFSLRRLKKRRPALRAEIDCLERAQPQEPA
ncbi:MAG: hypothetical protein WA129_01420 [Acidovorax sp.]